MPYPAEKLSHDDYKILDYINKFDVVTKEQLEGKFKNKKIGLDFRLSLLYQADTGRYGTIYPNSNYISQKFTYRTYRACR